MNNFLSITQHTSQISKAIVKHSEKRSLFLIIKIQIFNIKFIIKYLILVYCANNILFPKFLIIELINVPKKILLQMWI